MCLWRSRNDDQATDFFRSASWQSVNHLVRIGLVDARVGRNKVSPSSSSAISNTEGLDRAIIDAWLPLRARVPSLTVVGPVQLLAMPFFGALKFTVGAVAWPLPGLAIVRPGKLTLFEYTFTPNVLKWRLGGEDAMQERCHRRLRVRPVAGSAPDRDIPHEHRIFQRLELRRECRSCFAFADGKVRRFVRGDKVEFGGKRYRRFREP